MCYKIHLFVKRKNKAIFLIFWLKCIIFSKFSFSIYMVESGIKLFQNNKCKAHSCKHLYLSNFMQKSSPSELKVKLNYQSE